MNARFDASFARLRSERGSVLIIVLWICFGLVALTLYFANSMSSELRASDNRTLSVSAEQAVSGGARYVSYVLTQHATNGAVPLSTDYKADALAVGDTYFWIIGRDPNQKPTADPVFGLVDEASRLNLNTATRTMLAGLPGMTTDLANSILQWRRTQSASGTAATSTGGADDDTYGRLDPPRRVKGGKFESTDELRLVYGMTLDLLFGEDTNRNGALDTNEDDGDQSAPHDDQDGQLLSGFLEYVTVYSSEPATASDGSRRIDISTPQTRQRLATLLTQKLSSSRSAEVMRAIGPTANYNSVAQFMWDSGLTADEFAQIHANVMGATRNGLVNINTASQTVLACLPGMTTDKAASIAAYRMAHVDTLTSMAWIKSVLDRATVLQLGPYITDLSFQFSADIAAVGKAGRGYHREKFVYDLTSGTPRIVYRQDLTSAGWALGSQVRQTLKLTQTPWL